MQLRDIEYVIASAEHGSFTKAAIKLYVTEPALSQSVCKLENELGAKLFLRRNGKGLVSTQAGKAFIEEGRRVLDARNNLMDKMSAHAKIKKDHLSIAIAPFYQRCYLAYLIKAYQNIRPEIVYSIKDAMSDEGEQMLASGAVDLAFIIAPCRSKSCMCSTVYRDSLALILPSSWGRAVDMAIPSKQICSTEALFALKDKPFILPKQGRRLRRCALEICDKAGFNPRCVIESDCVSSIRQLVRQGAGISFVPKEALHGLHADGKLTCYQLSSSIGTRKLVIAWIRQNVTPLSNSFIDFAIAHVDKQGDETDQSS